jgi:HAD superfamily hydrolase (TIGR01509 family)
VSRPEALLFDLFGTLVFFDDARVPRIEIGGRRIAMTIAGLPDLLGSALPGVTVAAFLGELRAVSIAIEQARKRDRVELHTSVRFERTLRALGAGEEVASAAARTMASRHMDTLARAVVCPPGRERLLRDLAAAGHRLALISNFDDGATARRVLGEAGLLPLLETVVVSEEEGLRKPAPAIFERTCARLGVEPRRCLYIGDSFVEDIEGATAAGLSAIWLRTDAARAGAEETPLPARASILADLDELPAWLDSRSVSERGDASR